MLIKKNKYFYKLTLYSGDQKPFIFLGKKDDIIVSISSNRNLSFSSLFSPMLRDEYKVTLRNVDKNTISTIFKIFQSNINKAIQRGWKVSTKINLEIKKKSEKVILYNVLIDSEFPGFAAYYNICRSITFTGEFAEYTYA